MSKSTVGEYITIYENLNPDVIGGDTQISKNKLLTMIRKHKAEEVEATSYTQER